MVYGGSRGRRKRSPQAEVKAEDVKRHEEKVDSVVDRVARFLGSGGEAQAEGFEWSSQEEPHKSRRLAVLGVASDAVKPLQNKKNWTLKWIVPAAVLTQLLMAYLVRDVPFWAWLVVAYAIGGTINHSMTLAMHEISHNLAFKGIFWNRVLGFMANAPMGLPAFVSFKRYHTEHHKYQGEDGVDTDVPTKVEGFLFTSTFRKTIWVLLQPAFYALRPLVVIPKPPTRLEIVNVLCAVAFDAAVYAAWGPWAMWYLICGTLLGMGLHPMAGHFIAEHYTFLTGQETYSYYGPLNWFSFNVGYHQEHHDFPNVPGTLLPDVRKAAPEYYDDLPVHSSWVKVIWRYIWSPDLSPFSRVKRHTVNPEDVLDNYR